MEVDEKCSRCGESLGAITLTCGYCGRRFHLSCRTADEAEPSEEPGTRWRCRVCAHPTATTDHEGAMSALDKAALTDPLAGVIANMTLRMRQLERQVSTLGKRLHNGYDPQLTQDPRSANNENTPPYRMVLLVGDSPVMQIRDKLRQQCPRGVPVMKRASRRDDIASITATAESFLEKHPNPVHIILHGGYEECMEMKKDVYLAAVSVFAKRLGSHRPECSMSVTTVPLFNRECKEANDTLTAAQVELKIDLIDLTKAHRELVIKGRYEYATDGTAAQECSRLLAGKACSFLGAKQQRLKANADAGKTDRVTVPNAPARTSGHPQRSNPRTGAAAGGINEADMLHTLTDMVAEKLSTHSHGRGPGRTAHRAHRATGTEDPRGDRPWRGQRASTSNAPRGKPRGSKRREPPEGTDRPARRAKFQK